MHMNIFKRLAVKVVTVYANYLFRKAKERADNLYKKNHEMYYVASEVFHPNTLTIYNRKRFKIEKEVFGYYHTRCLTLVSLKNGCYYHTPDKAGNQAMSIAEIEKRRKFFIKERLKKAKLL